MLQWNIQSRGRKCAATGRPFNDGETCHTVLIDERAGFERMDLCPEAWAEQSQEILARPNVVSHWQGVYHAPPAAAPEPIGRADAETLLRALLTRGDPRNLGPCFILAAMLERKRILRLRGRSTDNGRRVHVYEHPPTGDTFAIIDPGLKLDELDAVQNEVASLLEHGLPAAPQPSEEPFNPGSEVPTLAGA
jgi:hypothetical protein